MRETGPVGARAFLEGALAMLGRGLRWRRAQEVSVKRGVLASELLPALEPLVLVEAAEVLSAFDLSDGV